MNISFDILDKLQKSFDKSKSTKILKTPLEMLLPLYVVVIVL